MECSTEQTRSLAAKLTMKVLAGLRNRRNLRITNIDDADCYLFSDDHVIVLIPSLTVVN